MDGVPAGGELRVVIVAEDPLVRGGLAMLIGSSRAPEAWVASDGVGTSGAGVTVVAQVGSLEELARVVQADHPDVALCDLGTDGEIGGERLGDLERWPVATVLLLPDDAQVGAAIASGARGVLPRVIDREALLGALSAAARDLVALDPAFARSLAPSSDRPGLESITGQLTAREAEVLGLLGDGLANKTIAQRLGISEHTVKFHVNAILTKLGAESRTDAVVRAARMGLVVL